MTKSGPLDANRALADVLSELLDGPEGVGEAVVLNTGDAGLLRSFDRLSPEEASRSADPEGGSATIAAHAEHVRFGFSLLNRWATEGGDPFSDARWDEAWKTKGVDQAAWS